MRSFSLPIALAHFLVLVVAALAASSLQAQPSAEAPTAYEELAQQGNQLVAEARELLAENDANTDAATLASRRQEALALVKQALQKFAIGQRYLAADDPDKNDPEARKADLQLRLLMAAAVEEMARAYPDQDPAQIAVLRKAAELYQEIARDYRTRLAGLYARLYAGDCFRKLGEPQQALQEFEAILDLPAKPTSFTALRKRVVWRAMQCQLEQQPAEAERAIALGTEWLREMKELPNNDSDRLAAHFYLAWAYTIRAASASTEEARTKAQQYAASNAQLVARQSKEHVAEAKQLLDRLPAEIVAEAAQGETPLLEEPAEEGAVIQIENFGTAPETKAD